MKPFLDNVRALGPKRVGAIAAIGLMVLAIVIGVALHGSAQPMTPLYSDMDLHDSSQVAATLDKLHVTYEIKAGGSQILVPSDQVDHLRLALAREGLPTGGSVGYEVFDRGDSLTSSQFQQQMNQLRALEGELGRTIRTIRGVRNARVHLVLARREPFAREQQEAQASVVLATAGVQRISDEEVQAIVNLVATAVPGLKPQNISVVDSRGQLLARSGRASGPEEFMRGNDETKRAMERRLSQAVEDMLSRTLGPGHVRAEASVEMDFDRVNETQEKFDPDGQVVRRQQNVTDSNKSTEASAGVSVQNNLPNPEGQAGGAGTASNRQEEDTNYEIGKTVRTVVRDSPMIKKISMAVLVDGTTTRGSDGKPAWRELSASDLDRIATLVRSAIGYDEKRGDRVEVVNMRFSEPEGLDDSPASEPRWFNLGKADVIWLATLGTIALVALFALGFVLRPVALRLVGPLGPSGAVALAAPAGGSVVPSVAGPVATPLLAGLQEAAHHDTTLNLPSPGDDRTPPLRGLVELVEQHQDATVTVIRGWLSEKAS